MIKSSKTTTKASAVFLATVLLAGIIAISSPSFMTGTTAQAQPYYGGMDRYDDRKSYGMDDSYGSSDYRDDKRHDSYGSDYGMDKRYDSYGSDYGMDKRYDSYGMDNNYRKSYGNDNGYKSQYQSYKPDYKPAYPSYGKDNRDKSKDSSKIVDIKKIKCNNININLNTGQGGTGNDDNGNTTDGFKKFHKDSAFICINNNDNKLLSINQTTPTSPITPPTDPGICEAPIDLVIVLDNTGSMGGTIDTLKAEFNAIISDAQEASQGDLRVGFITFKDAVTVVNPLTTDIAAVNASINAEFPSGGDGTPEASDLAKQTAVNDLDYRAEALKIVILITDAPPGGSNDINEPEDNQRMLDVAAAAQIAGIKVSDIYITSGDGTDPTGVTLQSDATISGGIFVTDPDGSGVAEAISDIIIGCGTE